MTGALELYLRRPRRPRFAVIGAPSMGNDWIRDLFLNRTIPAWQVERLAELQANGWREMPQPLGAMRRVGWDRLRRWLEAGDLPVHVGVDVGRAADWTVIR